MSAARRGLGRAGSAVAVACAAAVTLGVILVARSRASAPLRCAPGMIAIGPRCCGTGQTLDTAGRCIGVPSSCAAPMHPTPKGCAIDDSAIAIAGGTLEVGPGDWEAEGVARRTVRIAPFWLDVHEVTEGAWLRCVDAGACAAMTLDGEPALPVIRRTLGEARAYCAFRRGSVPSRDELAFAAGGPHTRRYPWGDTGAVCRRAVFGLASGPCGEGARGPELAGSHPDGSTPEGVFDLAGNVAEWTEPGIAATTADVFGGSWADAEAARLRTWSVRNVVTSTRSAEIGFRCAYASAPSSTVPLPR